MVQGAAAVHTQARGNNAAVDRITAQAVQANIAKEMAGAPAEGGASVAIQHRASVNNQPGPLEPKSNSVGPTQVCTLVMHVVVGIADWIQ